MMQSRTAKIHDDLSVLLWKHVRRRRPLSAYLVEVGAPVHRIPQVPGAGAQVPSGILHVELPHREQEVCREACLAEELHEANGEGSLAGALQHEPVRDLLLDEFLSEKEI